MITKPKMHIFDLEKLFRDQTASLLKPRISFVYYLIYVIVYIQMLQKKNKDMYCSTDVRIINQVPPSPPSNKCLWQRTLYSVS